MRRNEEMNEMEYNGTNGGLKSNPAGLHVYRKRQHHGNTTPAGVAQSMFIVHFYKHLMQSASLLPPEKGREQDDGFLSLDTRYYWS
jgi:hypothetical protein